MQLINYAGGVGLELPQDAQIVKGVSGNGFYLPYREAVQKLNTNCRELTISLWRQWDGRKDAEPRGVFALGNLSVYFDPNKETLMVILDGALFKTDIKDDALFNHFCFVFKKNETFKIYQNAKKLFETTAPDVEALFSEGLKIGGGATHATFDELRVYASTITENEVLGLYLLVSKGTQIAHVEQLISEQAPKYLGVISIVPVTRTVVIIKGEILGAVNAHIGDWVLMSKTLGGWQMGICYRWDGSQWIALQPEVNYTEEYHACLLHLFEIPELAEKQGILVLCLPKFWLPKKP